MAATVTFLLTLVASMPLHAASFKDHKKVELAFCPDGGLSLHPTDTDEEFNAWRVNLSIDYADEEAVHRRATWSERAQVVNAHNTLYEGGAVSYRIVLNRFAALAADEFAATRLGLRKSWFGRAPAKPAQVDANSAESMDWRDVLSDVKDQGNCGSCWAFSTIATIEGAYNINNGLTGVSLSEQEMVDCVMGGIFTCTTGGLMDLALAYVATKLGGKVDSEESYPYTGISLGVCEATGSGIVATGITGYVSVTTGDEDALKAAVQLNVVSVGIDASDMGFMLYNDGVFHSTTCSSSSLDHGVAVVGYGSTNSVNRPPGVLAEGYAGKTISDFWIVRNSWGTSWGVDGCVYMARNMDNNCGIATYANYAITG